MSELQIFEVQGQLVVDSRLIADQLGVEHPHLRRTIEKYLDELQAFGLICFENTKILEGASRGRPERYCYLNEEQATFLMTLSRNTPQVVACKQNLVKAFSKAKQLIKEVIPAQVDTIRELELKLAIAEAEKQKTLAEKTILDTRHLIVTTCPEPVQQKILGYKEVVTVEYRDRQFQGEYLVNDGTTVTKTELCDRYGLKTRNGKPDYKKLNALLKETGISDLSDAWQLAASIQESQQFRREYLPTLDRLVDDSSRQMWLGE
jgi:phage regulator Rha-like protein